MLQQSMDPKGWISLKQVCMLQRFIALTAERHKKIYTQTFQPNNKKTEMQENR